MFKKKKFKDKKVKKNLKKIYNAKKYNLEPLEYSDSEIEEVYEYTSSSSNEEDSEEYSDEE